MGFKIKAEGFDRKIKYPQYLSASFQKYVRAEVYSLAEKYHESGAKTEHTTWEQFLEFTQKEVGGVNSYERDVLLVNCAPISVLLDYSIELSKNTRLLATEYPSTYEEGLLFTVLPAIQEAHLLSRQSQPKDDCLLVCSSDEEKEELGAPKR